MFQTRIILRTLDSLESSANGRPTNDNWLVIPLKNFGTNSNPNSCSHANNYVCVLLLIFLFLFFAFFLRLFLCVALSTVSHQFDICYIIRKTRSGMSLVNIYVQDKTVYMYTCKDLDDQKMSADLSSDLAWWLNGIRSALKNSISQKPND